MSSDSRARVYKGVAVGGPMDGQEVESRFPKGILFVSMPDGLAWVYDRQDDLFVCRDKDDTRQFDQSKAARAAEEPNYDVRALPGYNPVEEVSE